MTDSAWIGSLLITARPKVVAALLRTFRSLDIVEEAFQEASFRALKNWPKNGPPRDAAAWLIMVGRNSGIDHLRKTARLEPLPAEDLHSGPGDIEATSVEQLDTANYRDDILRLLFVCCHPELPATQQIALALRIVSGLSVTQVARAFLVSDAAMEQRITRAKARIAAAHVPFEAPGAVERAERVAAVLATIYLVFNEGYTSTGRGPESQSGLCDEAIRLARLLLGLYPAEPEVMGLTALLLLQQARSAARFDAEGSTVLLDQQDRSKWDGLQIAEGLALIDKAARHRLPGPYQIQAAIAAAHVRAKQAQDTDWSSIEQLYGALERQQPSPVVTLNRAVAVWKAVGAEPALAMIEPLDKELATYFYFHAARGAFLKQLGRAELARAAFDRAVALANTPAEAVHIRQEIEALSSPASGRNCQT